MHVVNHPEADKELANSALWYDERQPGLGAAFLSEFEQVLTHILQNPELHPRNCKNQRKFNFHNFPHAVIYQVDPDRIYVVAVMHLHRRPFYWLPRLNPA